MNAIYKILKLEFPASIIFGECYTVVTGIERSSNYFKGEYFIVGARNISGLQYSQINFFLPSGPPDIENINIDFMLEEAKAQAEIYFTDRLYELSKENPSSMHYSSPVSLLSVSYRPFVGCWGRKQFQKEIEEIASITECQPLASYLNGVMQLPAFR